MALELMRTLYFLSALSLLWIGCGGEATPETPPEAPADSITADRPSEDFYSFFNRFASDSAFQVSRVSLPLKVKLWDYSPSDSSLVPVEVEREGWEFQPLTLDTNPATPGDEWVRETNVFSPDAWVEHRNRETGSPITYQFRLTPTGWMLVEVVDATV